MKPDFLSFPKIELHCHLDGSMDLALAREMFRKRGERITEEEVREKMVAPPLCGNLAEYLSCFDVPINLLQHGFALSETAYRLVGQCAKENIRYVEVRFAPTSHLDAGLTPRDAMEAVLEGLSKGENEFGIHTGLIICAMRHIPAEKNRPLLMETKEMLGSGVVGFDLAGDEAHYPLSEYADLFREAKSLGVPFTVHAGETPGSRKNVRLAVELGATRIGHGIDIRRNRELIKLCAKNRVGAELCPSSNLGTKGIDDITELPFRRFMDAGIPVSVNTDNRTIGGTDLNGEYELLDSAFSLTEEDMEKIYKDSVDMAFAPDEVKEELLVQWQRRSQKE